MSSSGSRTKASFMRELCAVPTTRRTRASAARDLQRLALGCADLARAGFVGQGSLLELPAGREQGEPRDDAVTVEAVWSAFRDGFRLGQHAGVLEGERDELHAGRVQAFVAAARGVHPVEAAHDEMIDQVDDGLGERVVHALKRVHALLHHHARDLQTLFDYRHLVALLTVEVAYLGRVLYAHDAHAVGAG